MMSNTVFANILVVILIIGTVNSVADQHVLSKLESEMSRLVHLYKQGSTSEAFSIAMKVHLAVKTLEKELKIVHSELQDLLFDTQSMTCQNALSQVTMMFGRHNWVESYQLINEYFQFLQEHCTNRDFHYGKADYQDQVQNPSNGFDDKCALCVVVSQTIQNYVSYHKKNVRDFVEKQLCGLFEGAVRPTCQAFVHYAGATIIDSLLKKETADVICLKVGYCQNPNCRIAQHISSKLKFQQFKDGKPAPWDWLIHLFTGRFGDGHMPPFDMDNDTFSDVSTFRGHHWRGVDCDQFSDKVYPGRREGSNLIDHDCNGIYGLAGANKLYENMYCSEQKTKSKRFGVVVIGDSAGAHFSIPEKFFNASMITKGTYNDLLPRLADQLDLPHFSAYTGHVNRDSPQQKTHSIYKYIRNWNLCNNNDYQNIGVNGASSGNEWGDIKALKRDQKNDYPLLMFLELIGNDVCKKSFNSMTTVAQFKQNILKLLNWLDETVPAGSHLFIFGLGDGQILYDNLHADIHPLNVTYATVYDFLNCLNISPCWGWLNSNQTVRKFATERAQNLSKVYQEIIDSGKTFKNFDLAYYDFPAMDILERKVMEGGDPKDMIQRCDGFHPNGEFHSYLADWAWYKIKEDHPDWIGEQNPFNNKIKQVFGIKDIQ